MRYSVSLERSCAGILNLVLRTQAEFDKFDDADATANKLLTAAEWALNLDAQYLSVLQAGHSVKITIPSNLSWFSTRVQRETISDYRNLRFGVGEMLHPLFQNSPNLERLFSFQFQGVEWLINQASGILADDMGLGKTVQVISAMRLLFHRALLKSTIVICPKSLIVIWERAFRQWAPELGVAVLTPQSQIRDEAWQAVIGRRHVILTNYEQFRNVPKVLTNAPPDLIVADEAHRIRNRDARVTSGISSIAPKRFWVITGTPIERDLEDLSTLLSLVAPNRFTPRDAKMHPSSLRSRSRKYILRRRKQDVLSDLPDVLDDTEMLELTKAQKKSYSSIVKEFQQTGKSGDHLALLTRLQQTCDIDNESRESCKVEKTIHLLENIHRQKEKAAVFSYRLEPLRELKRQIANKWGLGVSVLLIGEMSVEERDQAVMQFRNDNQSFVLLASSRVGSEGLTLVEANHVILFNQWWNPSANDQARDRVVRIGQCRKVRVYRFCCRGTIEESILQILKSKRALFDDTIERIAHTESNVWKSALKELGIVQLLSETNL